MAARKGVATRHTLSIPSAVAGSAADLVFDTFVYDAFAHGGVTAAAPAIGYDLQAETVQEMCFTTAVALAGQITNFVSPRVIHRNAAGTTQNDIRIVFSSAGVITVAFVPVNLAVASNAVATGSGTGVLLLTGASTVALPWTLVAGDTITFDRVSNNVTGLATPAMSLTFLTATKGA